MIKTDILIIGAGPTGLFTVFEAGLLKMRCHLIDALAQPGGQCSEIYPKKPIYDIPGFPEILAGDLTKNLLEQCKQFQPGFTLGERAEKITKNNDNTFIVTTNKGTKHQAPIIAIAGGLGSFEPRKPMINGIEFYEEKGVEYMIKEPEIYRGKKVVIAGGGDSALDWTIFLASIDAKVTLVHRRNEFRGAEHSAEVAKNLAKENKLKIKTPYQLEAVEGENKIKSITIKNENGKSEKIETDAILGFFGLIMKLGPIAEWGLNLDKKTIPVNTENFQTNKEGIFAIGDICTYPGKLKLILSGFHEGALAARACFKLARPNEKYRFEFTTTSKSMQERLGVKKSD